MIFDQNKKELLDNLYDERWHHLNYYEFMKHLTSDEIIIPSSILFKTLGLK